MRTVCGTPMARNFRAQARSKEQTQPPTRARARPRLVPHLPAAPTTPRDPAASNPPLPRLTQTRAPPVLSLSFSHPHHHITTPPVRRARGCELYPRPHVRRGGRPLVRWSHPLHAPQCARRAQSAPPQLAEHRGLPLPIALSLPASPRALPLTPLPRLRPQAATRRSTTTATRCSSRRSARGASTLTTRRGGVSGFQTKRTQPAAPAAPLKQTARFVSQMSFSVAKSPSLSRFLFSLSTLST